MDPVQFYKCLADDTRLRCLLLITIEHELCVCELMEALQEIQPKISRHLAQLRKCGLLIDNKQGQWVFYQINPDLTDWAKRVLTETTDNNRDYLIESRQRLSQMKGRPERLQRCCNQ
ncbi:MAG: ArsR family transcriptional regulator [Psychromonas sp.]|jgi:ArsR family transcriptional regulator|uniref:metalloregulator ArsR/SmtB family transcription factor n=1 Tax=Psychromonas sp. TaxID=1884585 RepID=UPI0039E6719D